MDDVERILMSVVNGWYGIGGKGDGTVYKEQLTLGARIGREDSIEGPIVCLKSKWLA